MKRADILFIILSLLFLPLFFIGGPGADPSRSFRHGWDLGHIAVFLLWSWLLISRWRRMSLKTPRAQVLLVLALAFLAGLLIELFQSQTYRSVSLRDLLNDLLGALIALAFFSPSMRGMERKRRRAFQVAVLMALVLTLYPLTTALIDEGRAEKQFPLLSGFETPFEEKRWEGATAFKRTSAVAKEGMFSLRVPLETTRYSGITLRYFPRDWTRYQALHISLFHPSEEPLPINLKIYDASHREKGHRYRDRFNSRHTLSKGWNSVVIPLAEVLSAPEGREMDLSRMAGLQLFVSSLEEPRVIFIDNIFLQ